MTVRGKKVLVAAVGDPNSLVTWGGTPFHLLQAGRRSGLIDAGIPLTAHGPAWSVRRVFWNAVQVLRGSRWGGYQYSRRFLEALWSPFQGKVKGSIVINCFQLYPPSLMMERSVEKWFFVDQTLRQLFDYYQIRSTIGSDIACAALEMEVDGYAKCAGVIAHSAWAARSVIEDYGVPPSRVSVVVPGANIDPGAYAAFEQSLDAKHTLPESSTAPLKLVFVGKHPFRKGLDRLLRALRIARAHGSACTLTVIGCARTDISRDLQDISGVHWAGFIDKRRDPEYFLQLVASHDVGCLLSRAEAGGIGLREYHALGLASLAPDTGGSPEHAMPNSSLLIRPEAGDDEIADSILTLERDRALLGQMKSRAWSRRREFLWDTTVRHLGKLLEYEESQIALSEKS